MFSFTWPSRLRPNLLLVASAALLAAPAPLLACSVCFAAANRGVLQTYYLTAAMLTLLPLLIVAAIGAWLYLSYRRAEKALPDGSASRSEAI